jgi:hypothetical protein
MAEQKGKVVQLHGEELEHLREIMRTAVSHLRQAADITGAKVHGGEPHSRLKSVRLIIGPDYYRIVFDDDTWGCWVEEDPPGQTRPCKEGE